MKIVAEILVTWKHGTIMARHNVSPDLFIMEFTEVDDDFAEEEEIPPENNPHGQGPY